MHKGAGAQPVCAPHGGVGNPPCLDDVTTSCRSANDAGVNPEQLVAAFQSLFPFGVLQDMERVSRGHRVREQQTQMTDVHRLQASIEFQFEALAGSVTHMVT